MPRQRQPRPGDVTRRIYPLAAVLVLSLTGGPAVAEPADANVRQQLESVQERISAEDEAVRRLGREAEDLTRQISLVRDEMIAAAQVLQAQEAALERLEDELAALTAQELEKRRALEARESQLGGTLAALQRLSLRPPAALLVAPGDPNDIVRSGLLMRAAIPRIEGRTREIRRDLEELAAIHDRIAARQADLDLTVNALRQERDRLTDLSARKSALLDEARAEKQAASDRLAALAREARDLGELLTRLEAERAERERLARESAEEQRLAALTPEDKPLSPPAATSLAPLPPGSAPMSAARGALVRPAHGRILQGYGAPTGFGARSRGVTFATRPGSTVVAPWDGTVVFAGPFKDFGRILIIEHGEGYHSLLAGMARIDASVGQWVLAGEPVGTTNDGPENGAVETANGVSTLYVELRRGGQPINPLPWLAASKDRVRG
ncbi:MAG: murein hydrolase activator EnvC family protein [Alphaproteobacteria bacterium]